ncbi:MAG: GAF domain-containing protein [Betaproteobacteria bacterium]|nr:GAF domain-containing protein [Betaproteobacteria bacterium]
MNTAERIRSYLFASGLDGLADHTPVIEKAVHDHIAQLSTPMEVSSDALYRYEVPKLSEDGSCSLIEEMDPVLYDLAKPLGGENDATTRKLKLLNILVTRATMVTGTDWVGIYQRRKNAAGSEVLVKLAYRGRPSRAEFPLNAEFAKGSTNSTVGLSGQAKVIDDVAEYTAQGGGFYVCDDAVQSEICVPILDSDGKVIGIIDAEASPKQFFNAERQSAIVAMALVAANVLP